MSLFSAPAWMMKGGGAGGASIDLLSDADPYKQGKTKVRLRLDSPPDAPDHADGRPVLYITNNKTKFVLKFKVLQTGFTENAANVQFRLELRVGGHWRYTSIIDKANLSNVGATEIINISNQINKSGQVRSLLTNPQYSNVHSDGYGDICLLFETNKEICDDQIHCMIYMR